MKRLSTLQWGLRFGALGAVLALVYGLIAPPVFQVSGALLVRRVKGEQEDAKNRWIWVRDGLALKESLSASAPWLQSMAREPMLEERYRQFLDDRAGKVAEARRHGADDQDLRIDFARELMKKVEVDFTGGDSYTYLVRVKDRDPRFAKRLVTLLLERAASSAGPELVERLELPSIPLAPIWPRRPLLLLAGLLFGVTLGLALDQARRQGKR